MRYAGHVARMGKKKDKYMIWVESLRERNYLEGLGVDGKIILKVIFKK
jgi:hypothetical protein